MPFEPGEPAPPAGEFAPGRHAQAWPADSTPAAQEAAGALAPEEELTAAGFAPGQEAPALEPAAVPPTAGDTPADPRPVMTESELSFHATVAGIRKRKEIAGKLPEEARRAIAQLAASCKNVGGPLDVAGVKVYPLSVGMLWAFDLAYVLTVDLFDEAARHRAEEAFTVYLMSSPVEVLTAALAADFDKLAQGITRTALTTTAAQAQAVDAHFTKELEALKFMGASSASETPPGKAPAQPPSA